MPKFVRAVSIYIYIYTQPSVYYVSSRCLYLYPNVDTRIYIRGYLYVYKFVDPLSMYMYMYIYIYMYVRTCVRS